MTTKVCLTHTPGAWCRVGKAFTCDGKRWIVKELRRETGLIGSRPCWSVWGKRIVNEGRP